MLITHIFLDLDDVCNIFTMHALSRVGCKVEPNELEKYDPKWGFDIVKAANSLLTPITGSDLAFESAEAFWDKLTGPEVWRDAPESPEFRPLLAFCRAVARRNICLLTSPVRDPGCVTGKMEWIHRHMPKWMHRQFLIGPQKHLLASEVALLIDDSDENVNAFRTAGGYASLFPRPWNSRHELWRDPLGTVFSDVTRIVRAHDRTGAQLRPPAKA